MKISAAENITEWIEIILGIRQIKPNFNIIIASCFFLQSFVSLSECASSNCRRVIYDCNMFFSNVYYYANRYIHARPVYMYA